MDKADNRVLEALARLESDVDFQEVIGWIHKSRENLRESLEVCQAEATCRMIQGYCQALSDIMKSTKGAKSALQ